MNSQLSGTCKCVTEVGASKHSANTVNKSTHHYYIWKHERKGGVSRTEEEGGNGEREGSRRKERIGDEGSERKRAG